MADELTFSADSVKRFLIENGGEVTNQDLVKHFKNFLTGPNAQPDARAVFKDYVNSVATIKQQDGVKYVILKKRSHDEKSTNSSAKTASFDERNENKKCKYSSHESNSTPRTTVLHSHSSPSLYSTAHSNMQTGTYTVSNMPTPILWSSDFPPGHIPQPPPRRKHSLKGKENWTNECSRQEKDVQSTPKNDDILDVVSPGSVKEKAHRLNKMANESEETPRKGHASRRRDRHHCADDDDDTSSVSTLDPRRKEWMLKSCNGQYHELVRLLREEPKLAGVKDHNKYTALHWAAKHGNLDVIKLIAGTYKIDPNSRTNGGYTALHIAAMFGREEIMEILINTYGADPGLRDYSGKRPLFYLPKNQADRFLSLFPNLSYPILLCGRSVGAKNVKDPSLIRVGSLNSKTKKSSVLSASGRAAITRMKSWGSADNIKDANLMPPPKTFPKKKKTRKYTDIIGISENWRGKNQDSDSDSAPGS